MELRVLYTISLLICLGQICFGSNVLVDPDGLRKGIKNTIEGVGEQYVDDFMLIVDKFFNNTFVNGRLNGQLISLSKPKNDVNTVRKFQSSITNKGYARTIDGLRIFQSILSQQLPPERYNGIVNVEYILYYDNATSEEIENTLKYLYGIDTMAIKTSLLDSHNFPDFDANDCPSDEYRIVSEKIDELKSVAGIKPKVVQDLTSIMEKFPCYNRVLEYLKRFVEFITEHHNDKSQINTCIIKENPANWFKPLDWIKPTDYMNSDLKTIEYVLSARLTEDTYRGIVNFLRATISGTSIDEIEKALDYLYDDVTKTECSLQN